MQLVPDPLAHLLPVPCRIEAKHLNSTRIGRERACEAFHRGGLASSVGPQEAEDLPDTHGEADLIDSHDTRKRLSQLPDRYCDRGVGVVVAGRWQRVVVHCSSSFLLSRVKSHHSDCANSTVTRPAAASA